MREASSAPTITAARPGWMPRSTSAIARSATCALICAAIALPSRIVAVTAESYRRAGREAGRRVGPKDPRSRRRDHPQGGLTLVLDLVGLQHVEAGLAQQRPIRLGVEMAPVHRRAVEVRHEVGG